MQNDRIIRLQKLKAKRGLSYDALAHDLGVPTLTLFRWLRKGVVPRSRLVLRGIDQFLEENADRTRGKRHRVGRRSHSKTRKRGLQ